MSRNRKYFSIGEVFAIIFVFYAHFICIIENEVLIYFANTIFSLAFVTFIYHNMQVLVPTQNSHLPLRSSTHRTYTHIPGTYVYLNIPRDFHLSLGFHGVESPRKHAQIRVKELKGQSFKQNHAPFTEAMLAPGQKLIEKQEITLAGGYEGRLLKFSYTIPSLVPDQNEQMISSMLALGDDKHLVLLIASYPSFREKELGKEIEECLLSLTYDPSNKLKMSMHMLASFEINCQRLGLALAETKSQTKEAGESISLIFTEGGQALTGLGSQHRLLVMENRWSLDPKTWSGQTVFQDNFFSRFEVQEAEKIHIDDLPGFETWAIEQSRQVPDGQKLAYHVVLFDEERHFEIRGYAPDDEIYRLSAFREVCKSFRRR